MPASDFALPQPVPQVLKMYFDLHVCPLNNNNMNTFIHSEKQMTTYY